jgi:parvulin-like peptidyl-prolyl isomerase
LLAKLKQNINDRRLFLELARKNSTDEATRNVGGDTNFKTRAGLQETYGAAFAEAAFGLKKANDLSDVVETEAGFFVLRQSGRQSAIDLPLEKVKGQIRTTLFARARGEAYQKFVDEIKAKVGVQVFDDVVSKAKVDTSAGPQTRKPFPGQVPPGPGGPTLSPKSIRPLGKKATGALKPAPGRTALPAPEGK